jgi:hypothetical protein
MAQAHTGLTGAATAIGEQPLKVRLHGRRLLTVGCMHAGLRGCSGCVSAAARPETSVDTCCTLLGLAAGWPATRGCPRLLGAARAARYVGCMGEGGEDGERGPGGARVEEKKKMREALAARRAWTTRRCTGEGEQENEGRPGGAQGLVDPAAMARLALAEALTNLVWAAASGLADVKASVNWMYAAKMDAEGAAMYDAAAALRDAMLELGLACDGGKDSLSMAAAAGGETVKVPWTLQNPGLALASCCSWPPAHATRWLRCAAPPSGSAGQCLPGRQGVCCRPSRVAAACKALGDVQGVAATLFPPSLHTLIHV